MQVENKTVWTPPTLQKLALKDAKGNPTFTTNADGASAYS